MDKITLLEKFIDAIEQQLEGELNVDKIALQYGYSSSYLSQIFKEFANYSIGFYINSRKLSKAAYRLITTDKDILEVSLEAGYKSQAAFTSAFSKRFGITPNEYRKNNKPTIHFPKLNVRKAVLGKERLNGHSSNTFTKNRYILEELLAQLSLLNGIGKVECQNVNRNVYIYLKTPVTIRTIREDITLTGAFVKLGYEPFSDSSFDFITALLLPEGKCIGLMTDSEGFLLTKSFLKQLILENAQLNNFLKAYFEKDIFAIDLEGETLKVRTIDNTLAELTSPVLKRLIERFRKKALKISKQYQLEDEEHIWIQRYVFNSLNGKLIKFNFTHFPDPILDKIRNDVEKNNLQIILLKALLLSIAVDKAFRADASFCITPETIFKIMEVGLIDFSLLEVKKILPFMIENSATLTGIALQTVYDSIQEDCSAEETELRLNSILDKEKISIKFNNPD